MSIPVPCPLCRFHLLQPWKARLFAALQYVDWYSNEARVSALLPMSANEIDHEARSDDLCYIRSLSPPFFLLFNQDASDLSIFKQRHMFTASKIVQQ